ncbi:MAG: TIGR00299 family protein, partial [Halobacteriaceae archaeon]
MEGTEYSLPVKIACDSDGNRLDVSAEFDDAADIATEVSIPTREIIQRAESAFIENEDA